MVGEARSVEAGVYPSSDEGDITMEKVSAEFKRQSSSPLYQALLTHLDSYRGLVEPRVQRNDI